VVTFKFAQIPGFTKGQLAQITNAASGFTTSSVYFITPEAFSGFVWDALSVFPSSAVGAITAPQVQDPLFFLVGYLFKLS
jgi:hypothetical protein